MTFGRPDAGANPAAPDRPHGRGSATRRRSRGSAGLSNEPPAPSGAGVRYRRNQPEIIKRILLAPTNALPSSSAWTFGGWSQAMTAAQFGALPLWLRGIIVASSVFVSTTVDISLSYRREHVFEVGTGLVATPPTAIERVHAYMQANINVSGIVADVVSVSAVATTADRLHIEQRLIAASTPIAVRAAKNDAGAGQVHTLYLVFYPDPLYTFATLDPAKISTASIIPNLADWSCASAAGAFVFGAYADIFTAAADFLCDSVTMLEPTGALHTGAQFEFAIGEPGAEVVQARAAITRASSQAPGGINQFPEPWRINSGDRVRVRAAGAAGALTYNGTLQLKAILP